MTDVPEPIEPDVKLALHAIAERLQCEVGELRTFGVADIVERLAASCYARDRLPTGVSGTYSTVDEDKTPVRLYPWQKKRPR